MAVVEPNKPVMIDMTQSHWMETWPQREFEEGNWDVEEVIQMGWA